MTYVWQQAEWPNFHLDTSAVSPLVHRYKSLCSDASKAYGLLEKQAQRATLIEWLVSEAISTSAIEGENLNRNDVRSSILNHLGIHGPPLRVGDPRAEGVAALVLDVRKKANGSLTPELLFQWQSMIVQPRAYLKEPLTIGAFRRAVRPMQIVSGPVGYEKVHYEAPPAANVPEEIDQFLKWYNDSAPSEHVEQEVPGLVRAAIAHAWLELIHPFDDGNGRVGRAVADHALYQDLRSVPLFSLSAIIEANRAEYYQKLGSVNRSLDFTQWVVWFARCACEAQIGAQQLVEFALAKTRFWDLHGESSFNQRQTKVINRMFAAGPAGFEGGMTTRKYINLTETSRATATRDLVDLVDKGAIKSEGQGRSVSYTLQIPNSEPDFFEKMFKPKSR